jgi:hypothetical protein
MAFRVPPEALRPIQNLIELPDEHIQNIVKAMAEAHSKFNTSDLSADVSGRTGLPRPLIDGIVQTIANLYKAREVTDMSLEAYVDEQVAPALKSTFLAQRYKDKKHTNGKPEEETEAMWARFKPFLMATLALDNTLGTAAKAGPVMTDHERIFEDARILTDVRLIFHADLSEKPNAGIIVHMLKIITRDTLGNRQPQYLALDSNDVRFLRQILDRAIKKEETLKGVFSSTGIEVIEPKRFF